ncbi:NADH:ubiquinone reductase (H(+)-translocating) [Trifolium repens]|nr:NADH:ubiquinone reductase (H(+)-translocating) [Trifolium repens]
MAARSSNEIVQEPFNPTLPPIIDLNSKDNLVYKHHQTDAGPDAYDFFTEKFVDFESLKANGIDIQYLFYNQQWQNYFEMLNGFVYYDIVKYFWQKAKVYDRASADKEYKDMVEKNKELRGKTRKELGLKPYREREIRSNILGINVVITQAHIAKILGLDNKGEDIEVYDKKSKHLDSIHQDLFKSGCTQKDFGKVMHMKHTFEFAFRMCLSTIFTRKGGLDTISIPHKHLIWFLYKRVKVNLAKILFDHMCFTINEGRTKIPSVIHYPRLISELIRQTKLTDIVSAKEKLRVFQTSKYDASVLVNMKRKTKEEIIQVKTPLQQVYEKYFWCDGFPTISEHDNEEVIKNFLESVRRDTGVSVPRKMVVSVPNWDIFKGPRDITRNRRKPRTTELEMIDEGSDDQGHASADEIEEGAENMMTEPVQKEKRTKKRHDRPSASEEDQNPAKPAKRLKTRASKPKGKISESNTSSIPIAQVIGSEPQPSIAKPSISQPPSSNNQTQPIDYTVPLSVVLPSVKPSSSSSSDTSTASDELIATLIRESNPKQKKTLTPKRTSFKKTTKKTTIKPIHLSSDEEPTINVDTTTLNQTTNQDSVIEHLEQHMCGVAFTNSNPNSPRQFPSMNLTNDSPVHKTQNTQVIHTPPPSLDHISRVNPPTFTPVQNEPIAHSEEQQKSPHSSPINVMTEQQHQSPQPVSDPLNKPLVLEEILELYQHLTKAEHQIFKDSINLDDDIIPPNLSKIKIIELKRKKPEPTIPFDPSLPFFNSDSEPNLELLNNAIGIRLKRFKQREEEALIFPSDMDADVRELEYLFGKSLRILSAHLKDKIKGRGANTVQELFEIVEKLNAPRLTSFNHEEECQRLAFLAAVNESITRSLDDEQARITAEMERQRLAEQEAFKLLVDRAVHIAVIETNKIIENQGAAEDIVMNDQNLSEPDSDKGKAPIVASSPPRSPPVLVQGSSSSAIPSVMQEALDVIKHDLREELRNEMDEFRADIREDMNRSGEATNKKIDAMMELLLKLTQQQPKP